MAYARRERNPFFSPPALDYVDRSGRRPMHMINPGFDDLGYGALDFSEPAPSSREDLWWRDQHRGYEIRYFKLRGEPGVGWEVRDHMGRPVKIADGEELYSLPSPGVSMERAGAQARHAIDQLARRDQLRNPSWTPVSGWCQPCAREGIMVPAVFCDLHGAWSGGQARNPFFSPPALDYVDRSGRRPLALVNPDERPIHSYGVFAKGRRSKPVAVLTARNLDEARQIAASHGFSGRRYAVKRITDEERGRHKAAVRAKVSARHRRNPRKKSLKPFLVMTSDGDVQGMVYAKSSAHARKQANAKYGTAHRWEIHQQDYDLPEEAGLDLFGNDASELEKKLKEEAEGGQTFMFNNPCPWRR